MGKVQYSVPEKKALREQFDRIKAETSKTPETQLIAELDAIGVRVRLSDLKSLGRSPAKLTVQQQKRPSPSEGTARISLERLTP